MAYLMHIGFDNSSRLCRNVYYFEYKGIRYKLIQNNVRKSCDVLLTIVPDINDEKAKEQAYTTASEFLSALSWQNESRIKMWHLGGPSIPNNYHLRKAKCIMFDFPQVPFGGYNVGYDICQIPEIKTEEQKSALLLFREAFSSNHNYLSFLFYWQVLEIASSNPVCWINKTYRRNRDKIRLSDSELRRLLLGGKTLGNYFLDDCRHAIAHIKRKPGKVKLKLDTAEDNRRIALSTLIIREFARFYTKNNLKLEKSLCLVRKRGKGFPFYANEKYLKTYIHVTLPMKN